MTCKELLEFLGTEQPETAAVVAAAAAHAKHCLPCRLFLEVIAEGVSSDDAWCERMVERIQNDPEAAAVLYGADPEAARQEPS